MRARSTVFLALCAATVGCTGTVGRNSSGGPTGSGVGGSNVTGTAGTGATTGTAGTGSGSALQAAPLLRLANYEFLSSLRDILQFNADVPLEPDAPSTGDFRVGGPAGDNTVNNYRAAAISLATQALKTLAQVEPCFGTATTAAAQTTCAGTIVGDLGPKFYRRPLDAAQLAGLGGVFSTIATKYGFQTGIQAVLEALIPSPYFLYHLELEEQAMPAGKVPVTGYSMASRLSYLLWGSGPDATLMTEAGAGHLTTQAQVMAQAARIVGDPRIVGGMRSFYEQWLRVLDLPTSKVKNPVTNVDYGALYTPGVQSSLRASFDAQVDAALWGTGDSVKALLTGTDAYVDGNVASLFGMSGVT